jgi:ubiquinone/menaquinone biosynthesis C-methylase UbiE
MKINFREWLFRAWYWYVNRVDKNAEILFMNYGYSSPDQKVELLPEEESNRFSIQLYHLLAASVDIKDKKIVEIGCGRGGGLSYITKKFAPAQAMGIDLDKIAVSFSNKFYKMKNLSFLQGDAQNLPLADKSYDMLLNVESSHRYPDMKAFLKEVNRILKPGGYFLYTDFRYDHEMPEFKRLLETSGMKILKQELITDSVVASLEGDDARKRKLVKKLTPGILQDIALNFAGAIGSETYNYFKSHKYIYFYYIFQKQ